MFQVKTKIKKFMAGLLTAAVLFGSAASMVQAQGFIDPGDNPAAVSNATGGQDNIRLLVLTIVNFILGFLGIIAVIMIIYGGFLYVTAAGKEDKVEQGKKIILYSVIGIIIILLSFALVSTVLQAGTGVAP